MADPMVLETQRWLNRTYKNKPGFGSVQETGATGWSTIYALTRALQIELGIQSTANNFGPSTQKRFRARWPYGIEQQADGASDESNVYAIIQGALWCKGYSTGAGRITRHFYDGTGGAIRQMKEDAGIISGSSTVDLETMKALLSMKQFQLLSDYGGTEEIRNIQQNINANYLNYTGLIPTDGVYGREMSTALIQVLQATEGFSPSEATGYFGKGTRSRLVTLSQSSNNSMWIWLATAALVANKHLSRTYTSWNDSIASAVSRFQANYCLPQTSVVDPTTWMSLFTSKGDPNRPCVACDTRFEITDELAGHLKADGYKIVGRYLTEPGQESTAVEDYFKAIRPGELERIVGHGLQYFPIFQEYSTKLEFFTQANGERHAKEAQAAAKRLGIPPTVIYFAVDYDATNPEVTSHILPYFRKIHETLSDGYMVGIYASRNICTRVSNAGYAVASFVSDMSTGFSGNLGFTIPDNWVFDQFHEISNYHGKWDLDRVAFSGRMGAVGSVNACPTCQISAVPYELPPTPDTSHLTPMSEIIPLIRQVEDAFSKFNAETEAIPATFSLVTPEIKPPDFFGAVSAVLEYLARDYYLKDWKFLASSGMVGPSTFHDYLKKNHQSLTSTLEKYIGSKREDIASPCQGKNDLAHLAYTTRCYLHEGFTPKHWSGWAGDLATGMSDLHVYQKKYPKLDRQKLANAIIGSDKEYPAKYLVDNNVKVTSVQCNYTDLCDDADAIRLGVALRTGDTKDVHTLSDTMSKYYDTLTSEIRYTAYMQERLNYSSVEKLTESILKPMNGPLENIPWVGLSKLMGDSAEEERRACCQAFAHYLLAKSKSK